MRKQKICILPTIYDAGGDITKQWHIIFTYRNPVNNKMERFRVTRGLMEHKDLKARKKAAERLKNELTAKLSNGWNPFYDEIKVVYNDTLTYQDIAKKYGDIRSTNKTFRYYINLFMLDRERLIRKSTKSTYNSKFRIFLHWLSTKKIEGNDIQSFDEKRVREFYTYLLDERKLSEKMVTQYSIILSALGLWLVKNGHTKKQIFDKMPRFKREARIPRPIPDDVILKFKNYFLEHDPQMWTVILFVFYTFIRPGELRLLKIKDIDFAAGKITVPGAISKNHLSLSVTMPEVFQQYLTVKEFDKADPEYYIFSTKGKPAEDCIGINYFQFHWDKAAKELKENYTLYLFKHTGNLKLLNSGIDVVDLKLQNRHRSLEHTYIYLRSLENKTNEHIRKNASVI